MKPRQYKFSAKVWLYNGPAAWHFITLPKKIANEIYFLNKDIRRGWGTVRVEISIGKTIWQTCIVNFSKL